MTKKNNTDLFPFQMSYINSLLGQTALMGALIALTSFLITWQYYLKTFNTKLNDRLLELNKLMMQYPEVALEFSEYSKIANSDTAETISEKETAKRKNEYALRGYAFFRLNFYEEAFMLTQHGLFRSRFRSSVDWRNYLAPRVLHPLVLELFNTSRRQLDRRFVEFVDEQIKFQSLRQKG